MILPFYQGIRQATSLAPSLPCGIPLDSCLYGKTSVLQTLFHVICVGLHGGEIFPDKTFAEHQTAKTDVPQVFYRKAFLPVERDITALHNQVLSVFYGCLDHFRRYRPEVRGKLIIVLRRKAGLPTADKPHFQEV